MHLHACRFVYGTRTQDTLKFIIIQLYILLPIVSMRVSGPQLAPKSAFSWVEIWMAYEIIFLLIKPPSCPVGVGGVVLKKKKEKKKTTPSKIERLHRDKPDL